MVQPLHNWQQIETGQVGILDLHICIYRDSNHVFGNRFLQGADSVQLLAGETFQITGTTGKNKVGYIPVFSESQTQFVEFFTSHKAAVLKDEALTLISESPNSSIKLRPSALMEADI